MKRILHIVGTMDRAGAETMVMNLYRAIDKTQYQFDFVYFTEKPCAYDDEILELGGRIFRMPDKYSKNTISRTFKLYQLIKKQNPFYAIHCHQLLANAFHLIAAYFSGVPKRLAHAHSTRDFSKKNMVRSIYQSFSKKIIALLATDFIACGLQPGTYLFPSVKNVVFIPNAIDVVKFLKTDNYKKNIDFFQSNKITKDTIIFSQVGRFMPVKNHEFSINYAFFLKNKGIDFHMFFVGSGYLEDETKKMVVAKDLTNYITFLGVREDIDTILANSDILLMPSIYEGFPVILVESQTAGTPALISGGIAPEVDLGLNLVTFCDLNESFEKWFDLTTEILKNPLPNQKKRNKVIGERGFDINISVKLLEEIYNK